ncbi:MAG: AMP-binding protein [Parahaliea sp.]
MAASIPGFYRLLEQLRFSYPLQDAVVHGDARMDFDTLWQRVNRVASALAARGIGEGDRLIWLGKNSPGMLEVFLACSRLGAVLCVANWRQTAAEIAFVLDDFSPAVVFWQSQEFEATISEAKATLSHSPAHWVQIDGGDDSYEALVASGSAEGTQDCAEPDTERALLVLYTAAFGGKPNGAQLSEPGLYLQSLVHVNVFEASSDTRTLVSGPTFHIAAWLDILPTFIAGGALHLARHTADAADLLRLIHEERLTNGTLQPVTATQIAELNRERKLDIRCFRSALNLPDWSEMVSPGPGISGCGQTEVVGPVIVGAFAGEGSTPFCGRAAPMVQARVIDEQGKVVAPGEVGELVIRGPVAGLGYWNRPELNAERTSAGGWWHTRDLARRDHDGTISFVGPKAQMLKTGGENVYASEVENALRSHPAVAQAAIIGTPDKKWGQLVTAVIVKAKDVQVSEEELQEHVRSLIARYKTPRAFHFTDALPMGPAGVDYKALDKQFGGGGYPGESSTDDSNIGASTTRKNR